MPPDQKKKAYRNDVTYVTNSHQPAREGERGEAVTGCGGFQCPVGEGLSGLSG